MATVEHGVGSELVPYERGLSLRTTVKATLGRFLPGATLSLAAGVGLMGATPFSVGWLEWAVVLGGAAGILTLGFGVGLEMLRRRLYPDAKVDGRRSFVAGLVAPLGAFIANVIGGPIVAGLDVLGFLFLPALVIAVVMFFAWLTPTPEETRGAEYEGPLDDPLG